MPPEMPKAYEPGDVESRWYAFWLDRRVFEASDDPADPRPVYCLPMPPPNVTGSLHMGHALTSAIEDALVRFYRMRGRNTLWQPGLDHAGIATQTVVERQLRRENLSRHDLGRDRFVERVWSWRHESGGRILEQQRELGTSPDWSRQRFTMDPDMSRAVTEAFVRLHDEGLAYRATRLISWCVDCRTALSDLEVENEEGANGEMFEFAYPIEGTGESIVVATTRPETMLGDTAVAVHPDDSRYRHLHGKRVRHPILDRTFPVIADAVLVDPKFGTGAVKVTPAHDPNDFATGKRHGLEEINILEPDGRMNAAAGPFQGMDRKEARRAVKKRLAELGLARGSKPHQMTLPRCQRCDSVVEPMISTQWFVRMRPLADRALAAVAEGRTVIVPEEWKKTYDHFLENIQDWCISRQLWWGHRIPAWFCPDGHSTASRAGAPAACATCGAGDLRQDDDVLDTWFSSSLWPFSTLGWPDRTPALAKFYPASDLETGYDILFFWVARMMMMGLHFMAGVPFRRVLLHGLVVDENGDKMSKVKGNVIDPLDLIHGAAFEEVVRKALPGAPVEEALAKFKKSYPSAAGLGAGFPAFGADAVRLTLASYSPQARRIALAPKRIEGYRHFCNKMWNAVRFALPWLEGVAAGEGVPAASSLPSRWILARLGTACAAAGRGLEEFRLDEAQGALYRFFWDELCDWYVEIAKIDFAAGDGARAAQTRAVLAHALETALRGLHPFMPFLTEDLWQRLPRPASRPVSVALAPYPTAADGRDDPAAERDMGVLMAVVGAARTVRSEHEVHPAAEVPLVLRTADEGVRALLIAHAAVVRALVRTAGDPVVDAAGGARPRGSVLSVAARVEVHVGLRGVVDAAREADRVDREIRKVDKDLATFRRKVENRSFTDRAPPEVVAEARAQVADLERRRRALEEAREIARELG